MVPEVIRALISSVVAGPVWAPFFMYCHTMLMGIICLGLERDRLVEAVCLNPQAIRSCKFSKRVNVFAGSGWKLEVRFD
jgi:hypothetical protein